MWIAGYLPPFRLLGPLFAQLFDTLSHLCQRLLTSAQWFPPQTIIDIFTINICTLDWMGVQDEAKWTRGGGGGGCIFYSAVNLVIIASEISIFFLMSARYCWYFSEHCSHLNAIYYRIAYCWTIKNEIKKKMIMADVKLFIWWASSGIDSMLSSRKLKCTGLMFINSD